MTQRNPMNKRNLSDKSSGSSRRSAGSAKPKSKAGASVYQASAKAKKKQQDQKSKDKQREERQAAQRRVAMLSEQVKDRADYKKWRRIWWIVIVIAIIAVGGSWLFSYMVRQGQLPESLSNASGAVSVAGLIIGYAAIIAALVIDFRKIRKFRREQEAKEASMSNSQRRKLDAAIAEQDAKREAEREKRRQEKQERKKSHGRKSGEADADDGDSAGKDAVGKGSGTGGKDGAGKSSVGKSGTGKSSAGKSDGVKDGDTKGAAKDGADVGNTQDKGGA